MAFKVSYINDPDHAPFVLLKNNQMVKPVSSFLKSVYLRGLSTQTLRAYAFDLLEFYRFLEHQRLFIQKLSHQHFIDFILAHRRKNAAPRTINRRLTVIRDYLNSQFDHLGDLLLKKQTHSFFKGRKNKALLGPSRIKDNLHRYKTLGVKVPSTVLKPLSSLEIQKFFSQITIYRDQAMVFLMLFCGLRSFEVLNLTINDIDFFQNKITVMGKGHKQRILPFSDNVKKTLEHYIHYERPLHLAHDKLFTVLKGPNRGKPLSSEGLRSTFRRHRQSIPRARPHLFRHTFCTNLISQGVSLPVVQKLMGHADIEVTMMYVHMGLDDVTKEYHQAIDTLHNIYHTDPKNE